MIIVNLILTILLFYKNDIEDMFLDVFREKWYVPYIKNSYNLISNVEAGEIKFNYKCHQNSAHYAVTNNIKVVACLCIENDGFCYIHYINRDGDKYIDNTLGYYSGNVKYYLIEELDRENAINIGRHFTNLRNSIKSKIPFYYRIFIQNKHL